MSAARSGGNFFRGHDAEGGGWRWASCQALGTTLPMVWYIPPLSPVADVVHAAGYEEADPDHVFATIDSLRIPLAYLAGLFTAGDVDAVRRVLRKLGAIRAQMRAEQLGLAPNAQLAAAVDSTPAELADLYRLLAIAKYDDRYVIPPAHAEDAGRLMSQHEQMFCSLDTEGGPGMGGGRPGTEQTTPPSPETRRLHTVLDLPLPPRILDLDPEQPPTL